MHVRHHVCQRGVDKVLRQPLLPQDELARDVHRRELDLHHLPVVVVAWAPPLGFEGDTWLGLARLGDQQRGLAHGLLERIVGVAAGLLLYECICMYMYTYTHVYMYTYMYMWRVGVWTIERKLP